MTDPTPDSTVTKGFWRASRAMLRSLAHLALIPIVAMLLALSAFFGHLHDQIAKV